MFEEQAARRPEAEALICGDQRLTYRQLNERANRLANSLCRLGVGPEVLVGICVERSVDMVVGLLGILKAGGAYVPLDPSYPRQRVGFIVKDAAPSVVLVQETLSDLVPEGDFRRVRLDRDWTDIERESPENPGSLATAENLAYVIYTSGSTGKPKGVMIQHGSVVNLLSNTDPALGFDQNDVWTVFHSFAFDLSVWEIWGPLLRGARLVVVPRKVAQSPTEFAQLLAREEVTVLNQTPAAVRQLAAVRTDPAARAQDWKLRVLVCGGEALPADLGRELLAWNVPLWNTYGPTEATVWTTRKRVEPGDCQRGIVSIGRPIANTEAFILDGSLQPVPMGVSGDLYIGGEGLARGYLRRPELDRERFVPHPFRNDSAARLYKTGDRARPLPDGNIEFLGRDDHQVKIRGFRVELGEIETALGEHSAVREAVVLAREDKPGDKRLVAYVVGSLSAMDPGALRRFLRERLPEYMVPSAFVFLDSLPLTSNQKVDRRALPLPPSDRPELDTPFLAPRTPVEETLCEMFAELLSLERIGVEDHFFELGGHSIVATQLVARIRTAFSLDVPLTQFFRFPSVRETADWISRARPDRRPPEALSIKPEAHTGDLPLSLPQENVWFLQRLRPDNRAYHFQPTLRFRGRLDAEALRRSLDEIVRRHEIYRTTFPEVAGVPVQRVQESARANFEVIDLQGSPGEGPEAELRRRLQEEMRRPFDLTKLPLVRWKLFRLGPEEHVLQHIEHHMVHDGWSFNVFLRELAALYRSFHDGRPSPLPEPEIQFADFACFQRRWMETEHAAAQRAYWQAKLGTPPAVLEIPSDRPRPAVQTFRGAARVVDLPGGLADSLRALSRREGCTLFMTMLAAFATMLHRYARSEDFCIGSGIANRRLQETEGLFGMLVNTVALRMDLHGDPTFTELLRRVRDVTLEGYENQDYPFAAVVDAVQPERALSHSPLCQVLFSFHDSPLGELDFGDLELADLREIVSNGSAKFDLNIVCIPRSEQYVGRGSGGITLAWEYSTELFDDATAERMIGHFETLLRGVVTDPERPVSSLPLLTPAEDRQIRVEFNEPRGHSPATRTVAELFEARAASAPDAPALLFGDTALTYGELNLKANQLAHYLRRHGVGPEVTVGVFLDRSPELIVGLLGILKAGGAYVPVDPSYPRERIAFLLEDAAAPIVLTQKALLGNLPVGAGARSLCVDSDAAAIGRESRDDPERSVTPDSLAYVMYTSGSTGRPKGVAIPHRGIVRLVAPPSYVDVTSRDTFLQLAPISFDASTFEIWGALVNGARLALMPPGVPSLEELAHAIRRFRVDVLWLTAGLFHQMVDAKLETLRGIRQLLAGGDVLSVTHARKVLREIPECRLINGYGPTENTTFTCCYPVTNLEALGDSVSIGRPIAGTRVYLLDPHAQLVPIGIPGELWIAGDGLAREYWRHPELTAEKFVPDPFDPDGRGRLYRTGDLARYRPDGNIDFLGREDSQVKVRGFRIELGEIETALKEHPDVSEAVVIVRKEEGIEKRLFAYVVPSHGAAPTGGELRKHLAEKLPDYMIPSAFLSLESLPLTPHGKVDRAALPAPDGRRPAGERFVPPRTTLEKTLADVWKDILKVDRVGVEDNFFELGGHSLLATQVISRVRDGFGVELPIRTLFESVTVAAFAEVLSKAARNAEAPITRVPRDSRRTGGLTSKEVEASET